jgi:hypothetical protein
MMINCIEFEKNSPKITSKVSNNISIIYKLDNYWFYEKWEKYVCGSVESKIPEFVRFKFHQ